LKPGWWLNQPLFQLDLVESIMIDSTAQTFPTQGEWRTSEDLKGDKLPPAPDQDLESNWTFTYGPSLLRATSAFAAGSLYYLTFITLITFTFPLSYDRAFAILNGWHPWPEAALGGEHSLPLASQREL